MQWVAVLAWNAVPLAIPAARCPAPRMVLEEIAPSGNVLMAAACMAFACSKMERAKVFEEALKDLKQSEMKRLANFGWHQRDVRLPLPTLAQLEVSCHQIGMQDGENRYLCLEPASANCAPSDDFSKHYDRPVYVCAY